MKAIRGNIGAIVAIIMGAAANANGAVLYDNLVDRYEYFQRYQGGSTLYSTGMLAGEFSTNSAACAFGCTLSSVTLALLSNPEHNPTGSTSGYLVQILSGAGNSPGSALFSLNGPTTFTSVASYQVFTPNALVNLQPNTNYWVALTASPDYGVATSVSWVSSVTAEQKVANQPSRFAYWPFGLPIIYPNSQFMMKVEATEGVREPPVIITEPEPSLPGHELSPAVPLPGTVWLMGSALLWFCGILAMRKAQICPALRVSFHRLR